MPAPTIDEIARRYAWYLGRDDYPAMDLCPYNRARSLTLYAKYWKGWDAAASEERRAPALVSMREDVTRRKLGAVQRGVKTPARPNFVD